VVGTCGRDVTRSVPTTPPAPLAAWDLQVLLPPDPSDPLAVHLPALPAQDRVLLLVAQALITAGELVQALTQVLLVGDEGPSVTLG
jgi:hypothetical protein